MVKIKKKMGCVWLVLPYKKKKKKKETLMCLIKDI
jgi:hypothetical protein